MGFMDKAKKLAEQAQSKLDEAQSQFNAKQAGEQAGGPAVEYDEHGRPIKAGPGGGRDSESPIADPEPVVAPGSVAPSEDIGHPDSLQPKDQATPAAAVAPAPEAVTPPPEVETDAAPGDAEPSAPSAPPERKDGDYTPPSVTSGDPLAG